MSLKDSGISKGIWIELLLIIIKLETKNQINFGMK